MARTRLTSHKTADQKKSLLRLTEAIVLSFQKSCYINYKLALPLAQRNNSVEIWVHS